MLCSAQSARRVRDGEKQEAHHVELLLEFLISVVYTELFKTVDLEGLKPEKRLLF